MHTAIVTFALMLGLPSIWLAAQDCPAGPADTIPNAGDARNGMALPWSPQLVSKVVPRVLGSLQYRILEVDEQSRRFVTKPGHRYPSDPILEVFRQYKHPGVTVTVLVQAEADSTRLFVFARSVCAVDRPPPPGYAVKVEDTLELLAAQEVAFGVVEQLRRDHPRRF